MSDRCIRTFFLGDSVYLFPNLIALDVLQLQNQLSAAQRGCCRRLAELVATGSELSALPPPDTLPRERSGVGVGPAGPGMEEAGILTQLLETEVLPLL